MNRRNQLVLFTQIECAVVTGRAFLVQYGFDLRRKIDREKSKQRQDDHTNFVMPGFAVGISGRLPFASNGSGKVDSFEFWICSQVS